MRQRSTKYTKRHEQETDSTLTSEAALTAKMFKLALLIIICCAAWQSAAGQSPNAAASPKADDVLEAAKKIYSEDGPSKALPEYERALSLFQKEGNRKGEAITSV